MFNHQKDKTLGHTRMKLAATWVLVVGVALSGSVLATAQDQSGQTPPAQTPPQSSSQPQDNGKPKQDVPAEAGGPTDNVGPYAIPKKKAEDAPPPPKPVTPKKVEDMPDYSLKVNVPLVNVDVMVTTKDGQFIPGLKQGNFRILEDGVPQEVTHFAVSEAPITAVLLVEFASTTWPLMVESLNASYAFASTLKKDDW